MDHLNAGSLIQIDEGTYLMEKIDFTFLWRQKNEWFSLARLLECSKVLRLLN